MDLEQRAGEVAVLAHDERHPAHGQQQGGEQPGGGDERGAGEEQPEPAPADDLRDLRPRAGGPLDLRAADDRQRDDGREQVAELYSET